MNPDAGPGEPRRSAAGWSPDELRTEIATRTWFHTIELGDGIRTPGQKDTPSEVAHMRIPDDLSGRTVIDIGAYDGFYSFEAERRGAARVLATDSWTWNWPDADARRNFDLAHEVLGSKVDVEVVSVEELTAERVGGVFDVVLFLGVLYHAPDPLGYLQRVRSVTGGMAVVETIVDLLDVDVPALAYYPGAVLNADASNHFGPNPLAVEAMLTDVGFSRVVSFEPWHTNTTWGVEHAYPDQSPAGLMDRWRRKPPPPRSGRMVFHAYA